MGPLRYLLFLSDNTKEANGIGTEALIGMLIVLVLLLICSAFFSSAETAFSSVNIMRLKGYVEEKRRGAKKALWIAEHYDRTLTTLLVGNNVVNIAASTIAATLFINLILVLLVLNSLLVFHIFVLLLFY